MKLAVLHRDRLVRQALRRALKDSHFELVASLDSNLGLREQVAQAAPQLLLVELALLGPQACELPGLLGCGCAVIALAPAGHAAAAFEALAGGALALAEPPRIDDDGHLQGRERFLAKLERWVGLIGHRPGTPPAASPLAAGQTPPLLALGASTGGPHALATVLSSLPREFAGAVLIVQHIEGEFTDGLVTWLGSRCALPVQQARAGESPQAGQVYVAPPGAHLQIAAGLRFVRGSGAPGELHVPSVDALFLSLARQATPGVAALLTGMGSDGVAGLAELRRCGWYTVAQDEHSSIVYGMPRVAAEQGAAMHTLPLPAIGPALLRHLAKQVSR